RARAEQTAAEAQVHDERSKIIFDVAQAYYNVLAAEATEKVDTALLEASQQHLRLAEGFVKTGEKPKVELLKAKASYSSARFDQMKAAQDLENAKTHLNAAMGIVDPPEYTIQQSVTVEPFRIDLAS